jgi:hypothetical protein
MPICRRINQLRRDPEYENTLLEELGFANT